MSLRPAFAVVLVLLASSVTLAIESPLSSGVTFPDVVGKSLSGSKLTVSMRDGLPKVFVMTFTRAGASRAQDWLNVCRADETSQSRSEPSGVDNSPAPARRVACYDVRISQGVPRIVRGFVEGRMKKGIGPEQLASTIVVYKDEEAWRDRLMVMHDNENEAFIVMVDRRGRVQSLLRGSFKPEALKAELAKLVTN